MLRRGGITEIAVILPLLNTTTQEGGGGKEKKELHSSTAKCFSNPHTDFGAPRSRRLGVRSATN